MVCLDAYVGGGFLMVPILATLFRLPMHVLVAGTIPFVITLSAVGLFSYNIITPLVTGFRVSPEWAWGFFVASTAVLGSWCASKTQRFIPDRILKAILGLITGGVGIVYILNYFMGLKIPV